jgi:hypothetical protein
MSDSMVNSLMGFLVSMIFSFMCSRMFLYVGGFRLRNCSRKRRNRAFFVCGLAVCCVMTVACIGYAWAGAAGTACGAFGLWFYYIRPYPADSD